MGHSTTLSKPPGSVGEVKCLDGCVDRTVRLGRLGVGNAWLRRGSVCPDMDALVRRQIQLVAGFDMKRSIPWVKITHDAVDPVLVGAMRIAQQLLAFGALAHLALPCRSEGDEETLIARIAADDGRLAVA